MSNPPGPQWDPWADAVRRHVAEGFDRLDLLTAVDRPQSGEIEVVIRLVRRLDTGGSDAVWGHTLLAREAPVLDSVTSVLPAAAWHEREIHEMFGVEVRGHADLRPLLLHDVTGPPPLRKDTSLVARVETPWPGEPDRGGSADPPGQPDRGGSADPPGRSARRTKVPGVPPEWLEQR